MNIDKSKVMVLWWGEEDQCEKLVWTETGSQLGHVSEFKYSGFVFDESGTNGMEFCTKVEIGGKLQV